MPNRLNWGPDVFGALLPLLMGGVALFLVEDSGYWAGVTRWVAEGVLMPPAVILCFGIHRTLTDLPRGKARVWADRAIILFTITAIMLFTASVQPDPPHTEGRLAIMNAVLYGFVVMFCVTVTGLHGRAEVSK